MIFDYRAIHVALLLWACLFSLIAAGYAVAALGMALVVVSQFTHLYYTFDAQNCYHRTVWHPISLLIPMVGMLLDGSLLVQYRKNLNHQLYLAMLSYIALPFVAAIGLLFVYGISLANIAISISLVLIFIFSLVEQNQKMAAQAEELAENRVAIMLSQIQPHFLYNALITIKYLCGTQDPRAETGGGTVSVSSWEIAEAWYVSVEDDGVGFDTTQRKADGLIHTGPVIVLLVNGQPHNELLK